MRNNTEQRRRREARERLNVAPSAMAKWPLLKVISDAMAPIDVYSPSTISNYRHAVREYQRFIGFEQSPVNVNEAKFAGFRDWLIAEGLSPVTVDLELDCLAAVVRFADVSLMAEREVPERKPFADAGVAGTVEYFTVNEYFPVNDAIQSDETRRQYAMSIARFSRFIGHPATLSDLSDATLQAWIDSLRAEGMRIKTINGYMNYVRAFWNWAAARGMVQTSPTVKNVSGVDPPKATRPDSVTPVRRPLVRKRTLAEEKGDRDVLAPGGVLWFVNRYLQSREVTSLYAKRLRTYAVKLARFAGAATLSEVFTEENVNGFLATYEGSPYTVRSYRSDFVVLWNAAADEDLLSYPRLRRLRRPKCPQLVIECYTQDEVRRLIGAIPVLTGEYGNGIPKRDYWNAAIRLAWDTGLRRGDVLKFRKSAIREDGRVRVVQNKTRNIVTVGLRPNTVAALRAIPFDAPLVWQNDINYFSRHFRKLMKASGVGKGSFKWIRRASGTYVEMQLPGAGTKHLGHSDPTVFQRHYDGHLNDIALPMPPTLD